MAEPATAAVHVRGFSLWYGTFQALYEVDLRVQEGIVTSMIGPSGCGKSTLLRSVNRITERLTYVKTRGHIDVFGTDVFAAENDLVQVRKHIGMVFQRPNPLPLSIRDNVLFGHRLHEPDFKGSREAILEDALRRVLLWDDVKDKLREKATRLSLEQQQKLCIARLLPVKPRLLLMDEPCSALDPKGTEAVESLIAELRGEYTILMVTHNMAQARRVSERCVFMLLGKIVEEGETAQLFAAPRNKETADYLAGRYG